MTAPVAGRRWGRRSVILAVATLTAVVGIGAPDAAASQLGELVAYPLTFPVDGDHHFTDTFWAGRSHGIHHAQDIMADKMTPVVAAAAGTIAFVNWSNNPRDLNPERCCTLAIRHDDGWESWYIHLNNDTPGTDDGRAWGIAEGIVPGGHVDAGQLVGWVGDSGNAESTPSHLHFELRDPRDVIVNPFDALRAAGGNALRATAKDPLFSGSRLLQQGDTGSDVARLQGILNDLGFSAGPRDGIFGRRTLSAVEGFQRRHSLHIDGLVGLETRGALAGLVGSGDDILRFGSRSDTVRLVQELLSRIGFDPGPIDGIFGHRTLNAVLNFQRHEALRVDGLVGPQTRRALEGA